MNESSRVINVSIAFLNTEPTEALKAYATEKVTNCVSKFVHHDTEVHVKLKVEKNRQIAEASLHVDGGDFSATEESEDLYASIDMMVDALAGQLRKHKEKLTSHK